MTIPAPALSQEELDEEAFLNKFKRDPTAPRPEWALKPDTSGSLEAALESVPLFMNNPNPSPQDIQSNPTLMALQTLLYDDQESPEQRASNFKEQGNEAYKEKRLKDAVTFYSKGLAEKEVSGELRAQLYGNRSAVWWTMERWTDCLNDVKMALGALCGDGVERNEKIVLRGIKCAVKLKDAPFLRSHQLDPSSDKELLDQVTVTLREAGEREKSEAQTQTYLLKRFNLHHKERCEDELLSMLPDVDPATLPTVTVQQNRAAFPMLVLYPEHAQCDFIESFCEDDTFAQHFDRLFEQPAPWDTTRAYTNRTRVRLFMVRQDTGGLVEVRMEWRLRDIFPAIISQYHRGLLAVHVLPKGNVELFSEFTGRFKSV